MKDEKRYAVLIPHDITEPCSPYEMPTEGETAAERGVHMKSVKISDIIVWAVFGLSCVAALWFLASFIEVVTHNINSAERYVPSAWNLFKTFAR